MNNYSFHPKVVVRIPLLPNFSTLDILTDASFLEAIYIASPELANELLKFRTNKEKLSVKEINKMNITLEKYSRRAKMRCTPFGLFSAVGVCQWGNKTDIVLSSERGKKISLDMEYLCQLSNYIIGLTKSCNQVKYFSNTSWYIYKTKIRYLNFKVDNNIYIYNISELEYNIHIEDILNYSKFGKSKHEIKVYTISKGFEEKFVEEFIENLIGSNLLFSEIFPTVIGEKFQIILFDFIQKHKSNCIDLELPYSILSKVNELLEIINLNNTNSINYYDDLIKLLEKLPIRITPNKLFHVDSILKLKQNKIDNSIQEKLMKSFNFLSKLKQNEVNERLIRFRKVFLERYGEKEVSLLEVFDADTGIDYQFGDLENKLSSLPVANDYLLHSILLKAYKMDSKVIELSEYDFLNNDDFQMSLQPSLSLLFSLSGQDNVILHSISGTSAANSITRFAYADESISNICKDILLSEQHYFDNYMLSEVEHIPAYRMGNVMSRNIERNYKVGLLNLINTQTNGITLQEINIRIKNDNIYLIDKNSRKTIIPKITSAHNYRLSKLSLYHFLGDIQSQNFTSSLSFSWGFFDQLFKYTPRATFNGVILQPATWKFTSKDIESFRDINYDEKILFSFTSKHRLPDKFYFVKMDHYLYIDINESISQLAFRDEILKHKDFFIVEYIGSQNLGPVHDSQKNMYENEFIAFVTRNNFEIKKNEQTSHLIYTNLITDSSWFYIKLYSGIQHLEHILYSLISPLAKLLIDEGAMEKWFFIRYCDPEYHLRLRFKVIGDSNRNKLITKVFSFLQEYIDDKTIWKVQVEKYIPETERYGFEMLDICEEYFFYDSESIIELNKIINQLQDTSLKWYVALRIIHDIISQMKLSLNEQFEFMNGIKSMPKNANFGKGFMENSRIKYRSERPRITSLLNYSLKLPTKIEDVLFLRSVKNSKILDKLFALDKLSRTKIIYSLIHMSMNRFFTNDALYSENAVYELLFLHYKSTIGRNNQNS